MKFVSMQLKSRADEIPFYFSDKNALFFSTFFFLSLSVSSSEKRAHFASHKWPKGFSVGDTRCQFITSITLLFMFSMWLFVVLSFVLVWISRYTFLSGWLMLEQTIRSTFQSKHALLRSIGRLLPDPKGLKDVKFISLFYNCYYCYHCHH